MIAAMKRSLLIAILSLHAACAAPCKTTDAPADAELSAPSTAPSPSTPEATTMQASTPATSDARFQAIISSPTRTPEDQALDAGRKPEQLLALLNLQPGMHVAELMVGLGYTTELLARSVGPTGVVYGQNNRFVLDRFAQGPWTQRLPRDEMKQVVRVDRELEAPLPPDVHDLDVVVMVLFYHDTVWQGTDRAAMNRAVFDSLKPGGRFVIIDHSGAAGTGIRQTDTLHRIEEAVVRSEVEAAGFRLQQSADFLRNPADPLDWNAAPSAAAQAGRRGDSDRFVLVFEKPAS